MSLYIDLKFLNELAPRLPRFKRKSDTLFNCRCVICGDSPTNPTKARGYFYKQREGLFYKCHNCGASKTLGTFLKDFDADLYKTYVFERYAKGKPKKAAHSKIEKVLPAKAKVEPFSLARKFERLATRVDSLPKDHEAVRYVRERGIPESKWAYLYIIGMDGVLELAPQYKKRLASGPARLVLPFYNEKGELTGLTLRSIHGEALRYIQIKLDEDEEKPLVFGLPKLNRDKTVYVTEGAIDSLFLPNAIACNGTSFGKIETLGLEKSKVVVVIDNQPRNKDVCRFFEKYISEGYKVCVWPEVLDPKDLNEMAQEGYDVPKLVKSCTKQGLLAQAAFTKWRKC